MTKLTSYLWAALFAFVLPSSLLAQTKPAVNGYTDSTGKPLPSGDTRMTVESDGKTVTMRLQNLYAYGEAGANKGANGQRQAHWDSNADYFKGGTVYALKLGNDWRGGRTAASVNLDDDKSRIVLGKAPVGNNEVTLTFPSQKAGAGTSVQCQPLNYLLVRSNGQRAWLGHPGWASSNKSSGIGDFMVLAKTDIQPEGDGRFPATVVCQDANGRIVPLTPQLRQELSGVILPPAGANEATKMAKDQ